MRVFLAICALLTVLDGHVSRAFAQLPPEQLAAATAEARGARTRATCFERYARTPSPASLERLNACLTATSNVLGTPVLGNTTAAEARTATTCWRSGAARIDAAVRRLRRARPGAARDALETQLAETRAALSSCTGSNAMMDALLNGSTAELGGSPVTHANASGTRRAASEVSTRNQLRSPPPAPPTPPPPVGPTLDAGPPAPTPLPRPAATPRAHY